MESVTRRIYVVRHGQADSLGKNYDQLTDLGFLQARRVGEYFRRMRIEFDFVACGTLNRQRQTLESITSPLQEEGYCTPDPSVIAGLNEFEGKMWKEMAIAIAQTDPDYRQLLDRYNHLQQSGHPDCRNYFMPIIQRILREWVGGGHRDIHPFEDYHTAVTSSIAEIPEEASSILLVTSSTPVAILAGHSLRLPWQDYIPLMRVISNTSLSVYHKEAQEITPVTINSYPHIQDPDELTLL